MILKGTCTDCSFHDRWIQTWVTFAEIMEVGMISTMPAPDWFKILLGYFHTFYIITMHLENYIFGRNLSFVLTFSRSHLTCELLIFITNQVKRHNYNLGMKGLKKITVQIVIMQLRATMLTKFWEIRKENYQVKTLELWFNKKILKNLSFWLFNN